MRDLNTRSEAGCPLCGSREAHQLPEPATQSMTSDWRVARASLGKLSCAGCGLVYRDPRLPAPADFASGYALYAHAAGSPAERTRQSAYAAWIAASVQPPARVVDVGCGNGSLLLALRERWPDAEFAGCDPSPESIRYATAAGLTAWAGTVERLPVGPADLVISVNVIEHTSDPRAFIASLRGALAPGGRLVLICPDAARPGVELLIADHLFSFTAQHLATLLSATGLTLEHWSSAPARLGAFQMVVAGLDGASRGELLAPDLGGLRTAQDSYLNAWAELDAALVSRLPSEVVCFGAGEAAGLLRAYAPRTWALVRACATDDAERGAFGDLPRIPVHDVSVDVTVLIGVRPQDPAPVAERLRATFPRVVTWYDLCSIR